MVRVNKIMLKRLLIITLILVLLGSPIFALASDISGAKYWAVIQISNNSTATTNVATTANISTTNLIAGNYLNASANNCVMRTSSGADVPFMPGYTPNDNPWCVWVPSIGTDSYQSDILYTANSTGGEIRYFPAAGGMTTTDNANLELGDNFTIEQIGWVNTVSDNVSADNLVYKEDAFRTYISATGNITSTITGSEGIEESYEGSNDGFVAVWGVTWFAQTFTPSTSLKVTKIQFYSDGVSAPGIVTVSIRATSGGKPTGADLTSGSASADAWAEAWNEIDITDYVLSHSTQYALVIRATAGDAGNYVKWFFDDTAPSYAGGTYVDSGDSGVNWNAPNAGVDFLFRIYGRAPKGSVTATGVSSGEHTVTTRQGTDLVSWWDTDWAARKKLTFDNSEISENLINIPVAVTLDDTNLDWSKVQADGDDIRFIDADDTTVLDYFAETWESGNETAIFWVEVPQIDSGSSTDYIYLYYANNGAANAEDMNGVFTADVKLAGTHKDSTNILLNDATSNGNDGDFKGAGEPAWAKLAGGLYTMDFNGGDDFTNCGADASLVPVEKSFTWEGWFYATDAIAAANCITSTLTPTPAIAMWSHINKILWKVKDDAGVGTPAETAGSHTIASTTWYHFVFKRDQEAAGATAGFINAESDITGSCTGNITAPVDAATQYLYIAIRAGSVQAFDGMIALNRVYIDEALSDEEIEAHYLIERHLFGGADYITFGDTEYSGLRIYIDNILKDYTNSASVPNNSENWTFVQDYSMFYLQSQEIEIDGVQVQYIDWEYDTIFHDSSGNGNDATPTFRTASSDADVSAELISFQPIAEAKAPDYVLGEAPAFIGPGITSNVTGTFTTTPGTGVFPLAGVITAIAEATGTPPQLPLLIIAVFVILAASLSASAIMRRYGSGSLVVKILVIVAVMGIFIALGNFAIDFWMLVIFLIIGIALAFASRQMGWS